MSGTCREDTEMTGKRKAKASKRSVKREPKQRMKVRDAMDLVDDDLPDGAYWAMVSEMSGVDYGELGAELSQEDEQPISRLPRPKESKK
jgi:hypothetical protein